MVTATFILNGKTTTLSAPTLETTLLDALREHGLTGAKEGCAEGECGACNVLLVAESHGTPIYRSINSCLMLLPTVEGREVITVEMLAANGRLTAAQEAMAAAGGSQCGYCTPGFVVSMIAEQYRPGRTGACDVRALAGNLCRCTGYRPIRDAMASLDAPEPGPLLDRLGAPAPSLAAVTSESFSRPTSVAECVDALVARPDARIVAGASDLAVDANQHGRQFPHLVSVEAIDELREFSQSSSGIRIGAALTLTELGESWTDAPDAVYEWLELFASPPIRNRATLGGNLATASPIGDAAPLLLAMDARAHIAGPTGRRVADLAAFFTGYRTTALQPGELLTTIELPAPLPQALRFYKVSKRRLDDISTSAAAMALDRSPSGRVTRARFCFGGVAATPLRLFDAEAAVLGQPWTVATVHTVHRIIDRTVSPLSDHRGSREYRLEVSKSLVEKFLVETTG